jgi:hypothetical protein
VSFELAGHALFLTLSKRFCNPCRVRGVEPQAHAPIALRRAPPSPTSYTGTHRRVYLAAHVRGGSIAKMRPPLESATYARPVASATTTRAPRAVGTRRSSWRFSRR